LSELEFDEFSKIDRIFFLFPFFFLRSSASVEGGQNNGGHVRLQGHRDILQKRGASACEAMGQTFPARGSGRPAGQRPVRQRSLSEKSTLLLWCIKVMGLCGQEQTNANYLSELEFSELTEFSFFFLFPSSQFSFG
jgi:hypothetical protein